MARPRMIIIGAGVAGLSAGCYAQMNGFDSEIFELHFLPGGLCTSWRRGQYVFDGGVRYLTGTHPDSQVNRLWEELGLLVQRPIHYYDEFIAYEGRDGRVLHIYTDIDRLEAHLLQVSPIDEEPIRELATALRQFARIDLPVDLTPTSPEDFLALGKGVFPALAPLLRWRTVTVREFAQRFQDPLLREALPGFFQMTPADFPMMLLLTTLAMMHNREAGYPMGGSLRLAQDLADRYESLGGQIHYKSRVKQIIVEDDPAERWPSQARGVTLEDGTEYRADVVVSACDGRTTIFDFLGGRYADENVRSYYTTLSVAKSILQISLGVARDFTTESPMLDIPLDRPLSLGNVQHDRLVLKHYSFDPAMAPAGKSVVTVWCETDFDFWQTLQLFDPEAYAREKGRVGALVIEALEKRFPGFKDQVEVVDVATPLTYERYTGNWRGAFSGWALTTRKMSMMMGLGMKKTLPGLSGFYMIGQWVEPGGNVELSAASGRDVVKDICGALEVPFTGVET